MNNETLENRENADNMALIKAAYINYLRLKRPDNQIDCLDLSRRESAKEDKRD